MNKVKLSEIIDAIDFHFNESHSFIDKRTNSVLTITEEELLYAEDDEECPDWMEEHINDAKAYLENPSNFIALPSQHDANEYRMMENFAYSLENQANQTALLVSLSGKGAFRRFKDTAIMLGIVEKWYKYRDEKYKEFVLDWCEMEGIEVTDS